MSKPKTDVAFFPAGRRDDCPTCQAHAAINCTTRPEYSAVPAVRCPQHLCTDCFRPFSGGHLQPWERWEQSGDWLLRRVDEHYGARLAVREILDLIAAEPDIAAQLRAALLSGTE